MEDECLIDSNINRAGSLVQDAMLSARGMVTSTVSTFKDKLAIFKKNAREILPKLKQKIDKRFTEQKNWLTILWMSKPTGEIISTPDNTVIRLKVIILSY